ncbi:hypothetical protein PV08_05932 [Exophiala spinifera]|uniref:Ferulic acid decarboxylase 1 n=1 Tax=Exophiala spinifera TaxID=91928 RepID=A0A0D1ZSU9_9EURO|nr:uncharacterized protein PV08_05932 [Exophiala spinifera]KIW15882.1 hypothetical protein PV08_05932 [Exophiala spinifera]
MPSETLLRSIGRPKMISGYLHSASSATSEPNPSAALTDFRSFIELLRHDDDLVEINREVDPHLEVAAIVRRVSELNGKAPLFNKVKGAKNGLWRMFGNAASLRKSEKERYGRLARTLGLPTDASWKDIGEKTQAAKASKLLKPNILPCGPCKKNKMFGHEIDLHQLPAPYLHLGDGGKYLQTYGVHILQTPDASWTNWSIFRGMIHDSKHLVCLVGKGQHNQIIREKWRAEGKTEIPWALAFGVPPALNFVAALPIPENVSEAEYVGALTGKPLDLVKCELSDLLVPAHSEIVFEGVTYLDEDKKGVEGPFGDYLGLIFDDDKHPMPLFRVDAITYRDDAIMPISVPGRITDESHTTGALAAAELLQFCKERGLPVLDANAPLETHGTWCALTIDTEKLRSLKTNSKDFCSMLGNVLFNQKSSMLINRIILVGEDVNIYDLKDIIWALATRCRPGVDEYVFEDVPGFPLTPYLCYGRGKDSKRGGKAIQDCVMKVEYETGRRFRTVDFETSYPESVKDKVKSTWREMGFDEA